METRVHDSSGTPHPIPWLNAMATEPFYLLHTLAFSSYFAARTSACGHDDGNQIECGLSSLLFRREIQAVLALLMLLSVKFVRKENLEAFIGDALFYTKALLLALTSVIDYRLSLCYLLAFVVIFVVTQQPPYAGFGDCQDLTPLQLEALLSEGHSSRFWLIEFRSSCGLSWTPISSVFAELSKIYSNKKLSFGILDLGRYPHAAPLFGISLWGQIPTYVLFDNMVEIARFPDINSDSKLFSSSISKSVLCEHFDLDKHMVDYLAS